MFLICPLGCIKYSTTEFLTCCTIFLSLVDGIVMFYLLHEKMVILLIILHYVTLRYIILYYIIYYIILCIIRDIIFCKERLLDSHLVKTYDVNSLLKYVLKTDFQVLMC